MNKIQETYQYLLKKFRNLAIVNKLQLKIFTIES